MKCILLLFLVTTTSVNAQHLLNFNKRFVESEDKWVAFQKGEDSSHAYGFIYIDEQAGLTLQYEGHFTISPAGVFISKKLLDSSSVKVRLQPNNVLVAFIPESKFQELQIEAVPEWLSGYKKDTNSVKRLYNWGYMYNGWNECAKALTYLEKAQKIDPKFKGLEVELAFSYNCLQQYDKAIGILREALKVNSTDAYINKELIYSQTQSGQLDEATQSCKRALAICTDTSYNWENCYNLLHNFYLKKDKANFMLWLDETKKWTSGKKELTRSISVMEKELGKID